MKNKKTLRQVNRICFLFIGLFFMCTTSVKAYIDPSVMTYAIQAISGIVIALGTVGSLLFRRLRRKLHLNDRKSTNESEYLYFDNPKTNTKELSLGGDISKYNEQALKIKELPKETGIEDSKFLLIWMPIFFAVGFLILGTIQMFVGNYSEFYFELGDILKPVSLLFLAMVVGALVLLLISKGKFRGVLLSLLFSGGLALFIQGNFVTTNYGILDGTAVDWGSYTFTAVWNTLMWILIIVIPLVIYKMYPFLMKKLLIIVSVAAFVVQGISTVITLRNTDIEDKDKDYSFMLSKGNEFLISEKENIIVFLLDAYDSVYFNDFMNSHEDFKDSVWENFIYYPNTVGGSTRTVLALPHLLTNQAYTTGEPYGEYINNSYEKTNLYKELEANNYDIGIFTNSSFIAEDTAKSFVNYSSDKKSVKDTTVLLKKWIKFMGCKYFPHLLKKRVWMYSGEFDEAAFSSDNSNNVAYSVSYDSVFFEDFNREGLVYENEHNAFRFYHLMGAHAPYNLTKEGTRNAEGTSLEEQEEGVWFILDKYFTEMKNKGVYDSANIIILADHGDLRLETNPLFMIKPANNNNGFEVDDRPVSFQNFTPTILEMIGVDNDIESVFELTEEDNKERYFYVQRGDDLIEILVEGDAYGEKNAKQTGTTYPIFGKTGEITPYEFGTPLYFDLRATGNRYTVSGFRSAETTLTWMLGYQSIIELPLVKEASKDLVLDIELTHIITDNQRVQLTVNDNFVDEQIPQDKKLHFVIPKEYVTGDTIQLVFDLPDATSPKSIDPNSTDESILSIALFSLTVSLSE